MTLQVTSAVFSACVTAKEAIPCDGLPVIALVGRSNVGKSSLINTLAGRRELAKTSSIPGKTLTINFYLFNDAFYIVDLPGYGYAKASKITRERIQKMMDDFFESCTALKAVIQILDMRHEPSILDKQMYHWIKDRGYRYLAIMNKADKLSNQQQLRMYRQILKGLHSDAPAIVFSAPTGTGRDVILDALVKMAAGESPIIPTRKIRPMPSNQVAKTDNSNNKRHTDNRRPSNRKSPPNQGEKQSTPSENKQQANTKNSTSRDNSKTPAGESQ